MESNLSQNDYPIQELNGSFLLPNILKQYVASCTTSVYVNLSKNSLFSAPTQIFARKRMQRYELFPNRQNFSRKIFIFHAKNHSLLTQIKDGKGLHLIIYINKGRN